MRHRATAFAAVVAVFVAWAAAGCGQPPSSTKAPSAVMSLPWDAVVANARGTTVTWRMWRGDPSINRYIDGWVAPRLLATYGITLHAVEGQGAELINQLVTEREAGRTVGTASLLWINGETFAGLRREQLLAGPWAGRLPAARFVDSASAIIMRDFEQDPAGFESPWGQVQFALIVDSVRTPRPPTTVAELGAWIHEHPGRFTHDESFTGMTFLKSLLYAVGGGVSRYAGGFDQTRYDAGRTVLFGWLREHERDFWRRGEAYPRDVAALHRLFANGEVDFSMSNNPNEVASKIAQGILPASARALLLRDGTIANTHYLGIPFNAPNAAGAMVVADFLLSPEAQFEKLRPNVWADGTVLDVAKLSGHWPVAFDSLARDAHLVPRDSLKRYARPEVAPEYHQRLQTDWRDSIRASPPRR